MGASTCPKPETLGEPRAFRRRVSTSRRALELRSQESRSCLLRWLLNHPELSLFLTLISIGDSRMLGDALCTLCILHSHSCVSACSVPHCIFHSSGGEARYE